MAATVEMATHIVKVPGVQILFLEVMHGLFPPGAAKEGQTDIRGYYRDAKNGGFREIPRSLRLKNSYSKTKYTTTLFSLFFIEKPP